MKDTFLEEVFEATGTYRGRIEVSITEPATMSNGHLGCSFLIVAEDWREGGLIYGATKLQAILLTLSHVADHIAEFLIQRGSHIDSVLWDVLERLKTPEETLEVAKRELLERWNRAKI